MNRLALWGIVSAGLLAAAGLLCLCYPSFQSWPAGVGLWGRPAGGSISAGWSSTLVRDFGEQA